MSHIEALLARTVSDLNHRAWKPCFDAVSKGHIEPLMNILADKSERLVTTEMAQPNSDGSQCSLLVHAASEQQPIMVKYLMENYAWPYEECQRALLVACQAEPTLVTFVRLAAYPSLDTLYAAIARRPMERNGFGMHPDDHADYVSLLQLMTKDGVYCPQDLFHLIVLADQLDAVTYLLEAGATPTKKAFWILGYNIARHHEASTRPEGLPLETLRTYDPLRQALERVTRAAGLPLWAQEVLRDGRRCASHFAAELCGASLDGPARRVSDFESRWLLPPADDGAVVMEQWTRVFGPGLQQFSAGQQTLPTV
eukprot:GGOE01040988.1.p1 GENE.GGOE01040988.1~~GGOE01040988.1.p1  ORF type:complete len:330 (+),score=82.36 GGOE01040988.1:58-990(+)